MMFFQRHKGDLGETREGGEGDESARRFCGSDGKQEEEESARAAHATRGEEKDRGSEVERLYLSLLCVSSADHIRRSGLPPPWTA